MSFFTKTLSQQELVKLLNWEQLEINKYMNGWEIQDQCILSLDNTNEDFYEKLINLSVLKIFEKEWIDKLEQIFREYLKKIWKE